MSVVNHSATGAKSPGCRDGALGAPPAGGVTDVAIPAGSVWSAELFDPGAPAQSCFGVRTLGGTLTLSHPAFVHGNRIGASPGVVAAAIDDSAWASAIAAPQGSDPLTLGGTAASSALVVSVRDGLRAPVPAVCVDG